MDFSKLLHGFVKINKWISRSCYVDLSKLINGFLQVVTWICWNWYMDFSKWLYGFVKVAKWICFDCCMDLSKLLVAFLALYQTKPSWSLTRISTLVEASALSSKCWMSRSTQCLGSAVPLAMLYFFSIFSLIFAELLLLSGSCMWAASREPGLQ